MKLQLTLFPGRANKHPPKHTNKRTQHLYALRENSFFFLPFFLCVFSRKIFFPSIESLLVTLGHVGHFSIHLPSPLLSVCVPSQMAVSMTMGRDTKWLTLEVCREFQRGTCSRSDSECKFAHPSRSCHVENGRVIACFDSLKVTMQLTHHTHQFLPYYKCLVPMFSVRHDQLCGTFWCVLVVEV